MPARARSAYTGDLIIEVIGLPLNLPATVVITRTDGGPARYLTGSVTLIDLQPGYYTIGAIAVRSSASNYSPLETSSQTVLVEAQTIKQIQVIYQTSATQSNQTQPDTTQSNPSQPNPSQPNLTQPNTTQSNYSQDTSNNQHDTTKEQPNYNQQPSNSISNYNQQPSSATIANYNNSQQTQPPQTNTIKGIVWFDHNADGKQDNFEPGIRNIRVFIDSNDNNLFDQNEPSVLSDASGNYSITGLHPSGRYKVMQELPIGWSNIFAGSVQLIPEIVGGENASIDEFPFIAALVLKKSITLPNGSSLAAGQRWCGGALISSQWVITAAHCLHSNSRLLPFKATTDNVAILLGKDHIPNQIADISQIIAVNNIIVHPQYHPFTQDYDVALVQLSEPVDNHRALLPNEQTVELLTGPNTLATVIGWGSTSQYTVGGSNTPAFPDQLQQVNVPLLDNKQCGQYLYPANITDRMLCAGYEEGGKDACQGDSGGPLLVRSTSNEWVHVGVVSWGMGCASTNSPGVYARTNAFLEFIYDHIDPELSKHYIVDFINPKTPTVVQVNFGNFR